MSKNIEINIATSANTYETLYPKTDYDILLNKPTIPVIPNTVLKHLYGNYRGIYTIDEINTAHTSQVYTDIVYDSNIISKPLIFTIYSPGSTTYPEFWDKYGYQFWSYYNETPNYINKENFVPVVNQSNYTFYFYPTKNNFQTHATPLNGKGVYYVVKISNNTIQIGMNQTWINTSTDMDVIEYFYPFNRLNANYAWQLIGY